jgi:hypothetical protein
LSAPIVSPRLGKDILAGAVTAPEFIPPEVAERLGHYVYLYVDPRDEKVFYVGKGQGNRVLAHLPAEGNGPKAKLIRAIRAAGLEPRLEVLANDLPSEEAALRIESAVIDALGLGGLTNEVRGWESVTSGRMRLEDLVAYYAAAPVEVVDPVLLIRINQLYRHGMRPEEMYDATRGVWKLGPRRERFRLAMAVFEGVVREVYRIDSWHPAGTTPYTARARGDLRRRGRWEFVGRVAEEPLRSRYLLRSVARYFRKGLRSPVVYVEGRRRPAPRGSEPTSSRSAPG